MDDRHLHSTGIRSAGDKHALGWQMASARPLPEPEDGLRRPTILGRVATIMVVLGLVALLVSVFTTWITPYCPNAHSMSMDYCTSSSAGPFDTLSTNNPLTWLAIIPVVISLALTGGNFALASAGIICWLFLLWAVLAWAMARLWSHKRKLLAYWIGAFCLLYFSALVVASWLALSMVSQDNSAIPSYAWWTVGRTLDAGPGLDFATAGLALMVLALATVWLGSLLARRHQAAAHEGVPVADAAGA